MREQRAHRRFIRVFELLDNTPIQIPFITMHGPKRGPSVVLIGAVHGEEVVGTAVIHRVIQEVKLARGTIYAIPAANMQGLSQGFRYVPLGETTKWGNLNRKFPGTSNGEPTERIASAIWEKIRMIRPRPSVVVDMHADAPLSMAYILLDRFVRKPNKALAVRTRELAKAFGVTVCNDDCLEEYKADGIEHTLTGAVYNFMRLPAFVAELGGPTVVYPEFVEIGVNGVKNILAKLGMLPEQWKPVVAPSINAPYPLRTCAVAGRDRSGLVEYHVKLGERVKRGAIIATIRDVFGRPKGVINSPADGFVLALGYSAVPQPGATVALLAVRDQNP